MKFRTSYILALDLGAASLGWTMIEVDGADPPNPLALVDGGVRIFEAGVEGDIEQGKDASRAVVRRQARQPRRQQWRRVRRKQQVFSALQQFGLLPPSSSHSSADRKAALDALDAALRGQWLPAGEHDTAQKLTYALRDAAAERVLAPFELGRALYHLAQRRGYLSNRKSHRQDEDLGLVEGNIQLAQAKLDAHGTTLGQEFNRNVRPVDQRIRRQWLGRKQYRDEFNRIRATQGPTAGLRDEDWKRLETLLYFQRPLKSQAHLIGRCELEYNGRSGRWRKGLRRCLLALPVAQEFRILQKVNDLRVTSRIRRDEPLTDTEREHLLEKLRKAGDLTWAQIKKLLGFSKDAKFSLEEWEEKGLVGHRTNAKMAEVFGLRWFSLSELEQEAIVLDVVHFRHPEPLARRAIKHWNLSPAAANQLATLQLEDDYASHSKSAIRKLIAGTPDVRGLAAGGSYGTIRRELYPESFAAGKIFDRLAPVVEWKTDIRNPAVIRALTELRRVVNAVIAKYGKPWKIHLELARELRNSRQKRKEQAQQMQKNRRRREQAKLDIIREAKVINPNGRDLEKWALAEECNFMCPYCGANIVRTQLFGEGAHFNIEHIYPRRYLDDSFLNKTIACRTCNDKKGDRSPARAFQGTKLAEILQRVERFQGEAAKIKLERFQAEEPPEGFADRSLNDTRYNSKLAAAFVGLLFGGRNDANNRQRVITPTGQLTAKLRANWQLNDLLGDPNNEKERGDHRHHMIDAVVIGLQTQKNIQLFADAASQGESIHSRHFFSQIAFPWPSFKRDVRDLVARVRVSHRTTHTLAGPLHAVTIYSKNFGDEKQPEHRVRKALSKLTAKEIDGNQIVDARVRAVVQMKFAELGRGLPSKLWTDEPRLTGEQQQAFPFLQPKNRNGPGSIIRRVRVRMDVKPRRVSSAERERFYASGQDTNYAALIYAKPDKQGNEKWEHEILDRLTAHERLSAHRDHPGEKVLLPDGTPGRVLIFALRKNDMLLLKDEAAADQLYRVQSFSKDEIQLCEHTVLTVRGDNRTKLNRITSADALRKRSARLVNISPIGEVIA